MRQWHRLFAWSALSLASCGQEKFDGTGGTIEIPADTAPPAYSEDTDIDETIFANDTTLSTWFEVDLELIYGTNSLGERSVSTGPVYDSWGVIILDVDPGTWQITAYAPESDACNHSEWAELGRGDTLYWTLTEFPGTRDTAGLCVLPVIQ